jgi:two-component sensor histidine kinase
VAGTQQDDATPPPAEVHRLPFLPTSNRTARGLLSAYLRSTPLGTSLSQDAAIVLGELVANSLDHGRPDARDGLEVTWRLDGGRLQLSVCDGGGGATRPQVVAAGPWATRGRGLAMVQALAESWWVDDATGTCVTAVLAPATD